MEKTAEEILEELDKTPQMFVATLEQRLDDDPGYLGLESTKEMLVMLAQNDDEWWHRALDIFKQKKLTQRVKGIVKRLTIAKDDSTGQIFLKEILPDAPVHDATIVPDKWQIRPVVLGRYAMAHRKTTQQGDSPVITFEGVSYVPVVVVARLKDIHSGEEWRKIAWRGENKWHYATVALVKLRDARSLVNALGGTGLHVSSVNSSLMVKYFDDYHAANMDTLPAKVVTKQMGWQRGDYGSGFVLANEHIAPEGAQEISFVGADKGEQQLTRSLSCDGSFDEWREAVVTIKDKPLIMAAIYASLAAPMLDLLNAKNFVVDWCYKTSSGKTTTLSLAASVWGRPDPQSHDNIVSSWDATQVAIERMAAAMSCLPLILDDTKRAATYRGVSAVPQAIYEITNGAGRQRGSAEGKQEAQSWRTVLLTTGEQRIIDFDQSGGIPARVLTLWGNPFNESTARSGELVRKLRRAINDNYGHLGPAFVRCLVDSFDSIPTWRNQHKDLAAQFANRLPGGNLSVIERTAEYLATLRLTAHLVHQAGLLPFEYANTIEQLVPYVAEPAQEADREREALVTVADFVNANGHRFADPGADIDDPPNQGWAGILKDDTVCLFKSELVRLLKQSGHEPKSIIKQWLAKSVIRGGQDSYTTVVKLDKKCIRVVAFDKNAIELA